MGVGQCLKCLTTAEGKGFARPDLEAKGKTSTNKRYDGLPVCEKLSRY